MSAPPPPRLTTLAQQWVAGALAPGALAVDLTAGNGHDTAFLAAAVAPSGQVLAMDCQAAAIKATRARVGDLPHAGQVLLRRANHATLPDLLPAGWPGRLSAAMANLGYLPGADKRVTTQPASTRQALVSVWAALRPGGRLAVLAYRGHPGGEAEAATVARWVEGLPPRARELPPTHGCRADSPVLWRLQR